MEAVVYPQPVQTHRGRRVLFTAVILISVTVALYFIVTSFFMPSWLLGEELDPQAQYLEIQQKDLEDHPMLEKFLTETARNPQAPVTGISTIIRGTSFEGEDLQKFLENHGLSQAPYPYIIKFQDKYYGLDILFQFRSPLIQ